jgi:predicted NAD/FAD-binding protein
MRIAIIGGGIAGLATAWLLQKDHDITLYEAASFLGGHARSIPVPCGDRVVYAETGFKYFFDGPYPTVMALMRTLGLTLRRCRASFSMTRTGHRVLVLPPRSPGHVGRLLANPQMLREAVGLYRFLAAGTELLTAKDWGPTLRQYVGRQPAFERIAGSFLYPFLASCWGAPQTLMPDFPAYDVLKVMRRGKGEGPGFYEIDGGVSTYVSALLSELGAARLLPGVGAARLQWTGVDWEVEDTSGDASPYDHVVIATSARHAGDLLSGVPEGAPLAALVRQFSHFDTHIVIHRDPGLMPERRADWAIVNVRVDGDAAWTTEWSGWRESLPVFRSWLPRGRPLPAGVVHEESFHHLVVTHASPALQRAIAAEQGRSGLFLAGMYTTDVDNHESALCSAVGLARALAPQSPNLQRLAASLDLERTSAFCRLHARDRT